MKKIGFIGLGAMGLAMAGNLHRAGFQIHAWARRPESIAAARPWLAEVHATPMAVASACDGVVTMVTNSNDVRELVCREDGLLKAAQPGFIHIDMSTIAPQAARELASLYQQQQANFVDAPVSGGANRAAEASLSIMAGGDAAIIVKLQPVFAVLGKTFRHIGPAGAGQVAKACNQMVFVNTIEAVAEALFFTQANGVDGRRVMRALLGGSAWSSALELMGERMLAGEFKNGIASRLHHKDFQILLSDAAVSGASLPIAAQTIQQLSALMAKECGGDTSALITVLQSSGKKEGV